MLFTCIHLAHFKHSAIFHKRPHFTRFFTCIKFQKYKKCAVRFTSKEFTQRGSKKVSFAETVCRCKHDRSAAAHLIKLSFTCKKNIFEHKITGNILPTLLLTVLDIHFVQPAKCKVHEPHDYFIVTLQYFFFDTNNKVMWK